MADQSTTSSPALASSRAQAVARVAVARVIALLVVPFVVATSEASDCGAMPDLAAARLAWSKARNADRSNPDQTCRTYGIQFYQAVEARQAASTCKAGSDRQREIEILDSEIEALNDLIAARCGT
jgi:hypothetical protein